MKTIQTIFLILSFGIISAQNLTLKDLEIESFYTEKETQNGLIKGLDKIETFSNNDINLDFSNIYDLNFLQEIPKDNKMIMIGETHYAKNISHLKNRIFFGLNSMDYYPIIIVENPYSIGEYYNYYAHLIDDEEAKKFLEIELSKLLYVEDDLSFIENLRQWNKKNKNKQLSIGGDDLEFTYNKIVDEVLRPYFHKLKEVNKEDIDKIINLGMKQENYFFVKIQPYLSQAKNQNLIGKYPFITPQYIENVIKNFSSTNNAFRYSFDYYRQHAIIRNISDVNFHGKFLKESKTVIYGGGRHMKTHFTYPDNANFLGEGSYFNYNYNSTKGKTYSIMLDCLSYSYGQMSNRKIKNCVRQGSQYTQIINIFEKGVKNNLIDENKPYFLYETKNEILKFISQFYFQHKSISFSKQQWEKIKNFDYKDDKKTERFIETKDKYFKDYDKYIIVPASEITTARLKK